MKTPLFYFHVLLICLLSSTTRAETIWLEGEDATSDNFNQHSWYSASDVHLDWLSPGSPGAGSGAWLAHFENAASSVEASYTFTVSEGGSYLFWMRANPHSAHYAYSFDSGAYSDLDNDAIARERINLTSPIFDLRFIAWFRVAQVDLSPGSHSLTIRVTESDISGQTHAGIDALALVNHQWAPSGAAQPPSGSGTPAADQWFALFPDDDAHSPQSITDMSHLLQAPAGQFGFVQRSGDSFQFADGTAVKFWAVNAGLGETQAIQEQQARLYAKHGINMVRLHPVWDLLGGLEADGNGGRQLNPGNLDRLDRWFSTLKDQGIYMTWSLFYPHIITPADGYPTDLYNELPDRDGGKSTSGMVNFMPALQDAEWEWERRLLDHTNPYTGLRYRDDPALAIVEVHNEDCLFWHAPLNPLASGSEFPLHTAELKRQWQQWVAAKYTTDQALNAAWGAGAHTGDAVDNQNMDIYGAWQMPVDGPADTDEHPRLGDFIQFLAETQRAYYQRRFTRMRNLGYQAVTVATAWKAGGPAANSGNLWADDAADAIDRHNYFGGGAGGHNITTGTVNNGSHMSRPFRGILSIGLFQVEDKPFVISEWTQLPPNQWKAEVAPLMAFYGMGLQGWDASIHFAASRPRLGGGWPSLRSYVTETPHYLGQFPALAFAIHHNHFAQGDLVAARRITLAEAFQGSDALHQDISGDGDINESSGDLATPTEVMAIGRVTAKIGDGQEASANTDWTTYWDQNSKTVSSTTGELLWDYDNQVVQLRSSKTQGVIGFAGGGSYDLPGVNITVTTPFVSLLLTPLDNRDLIESDQILITAMARDEQTGTQYNSQGTELLEAGTPPLLLQPVQASMTFKGDPILSAQVVDIYGVPTARPVPLSGNTIVIDGTYASYYYQVTRTPVVYPDGGAPDTATAVDAATSAVDSATTHNDVTVSGDSNPPQGDAGLPDIDSTDVTGADVSHTDSASPQADAGVTPEEAGQNTGSKADSSTGQPVLGQGCDCSAVDVHDTLWFLYGLPLALLVLRRQRDRRQQQSCAGKNRS